MTDLRFALRRLLASPGFLVTAVLTLALGMGANTLAFSVVHGLLLRPLPFGDADRIVWIFARTPQAPGERETVSGDEGDALARRTPAFAATAAIGDSGLVRELPSRHDRWRGIWATAGLSEVLRVRPIAGAIPATLPPDGAPRAMLIGHERWMRDFGGDPSIVGQTLAFADNKRFVVAGVLPAGLEFPYVRPPHKGHGAGFTAGVQDFWILAPDRAGEHPGGVMIARLRDAVSMNASASAVASTSAALASSLPQQNGGRSLLAIPLRTQVLGMLEQVLPLVQLFSALVLLIACANLANLMFARAAAARSDMSIRVALGARRSDLARLYAIEALVIAATAALLGLVLARLGRDALSAMAPRHGALLARVTLDGSVLALAAGIAIAVTMVCAIVPILRQPRGPIGTVMAASRHTTRGLRRTLGSVAIAQIALTVTLLAGAAALRASLDRLLSVDAGYDATGVITADTLLYIPNKEAAVSLATLASRLRALPFVESVGFVHSAPLTGKWIVRDTFDVMDGPAAGRTPEMPGSFVAPEFFKTMRIPLLAGRAFEDRDLGRRDFPIIINDVAARRFFPHRNPVGAQVRMTGRLREIVGVVKATRDLRPDAEPEPQWYQPGLSGSSELLVRVAGRPHDRVAAVRDQIAASDPRIIVNRILPLEDVAADTVLERRMASHVVSIFAGTALALAAVGLFGVMHFGVLRQRREFAIRSALGATRSRILRGVLQHSLGLAGAGIAVGASFSALLAGVLQRLLFDTAAFSPSTLGLAAAILVMVSTAAAFLPAWRAATADPVAVLKPE
jgi:putative ABC transport system permease protein